ncbi:uncharacterized protein [Ptychodera flava]|uniref:uncharacterized protein n=1 Tax=Ptychodera flava TaxID=63121 RepID=UPI00396A0757
MEAISAMKKYGTLDKQLSTIFRQKEARKQVQRERRRAALLKKSQKKSQMKDALQDGQLIDCISEIKTASSKVCNIQIHMWAQLQEFGVEVHSKEKLVGRSKITTVDSKRKLLTDLVKANPLINASIKCAMSSNESSSDDDDDDYDDDEDLIIDLQPLSKLRAQMDMHH